MAQVQRRKGRRDRRGRAHRVGLAGRPRRDRRLAHDGGGQPLLVPCRAHGGTLRPRRGLVPDGHGAILRRGHRHERFARRAPPPEHPQAGPRRGKPHRGEKEARGRGEPVSGDDLDFTRPSGAPPPPPEKLAEARKEANTGTPRLEKTGFYVAMARHAQGGMVMPKEGPRHCILIIEDDNTLLKLVSEVLLQAGFRVRTARNRAEINTEINKTPLPDLLLLDVTLPDADGFQILERIRAAPKLSSLPV